MVKAIVIICDQSPIGNNSAMESIRLGAGLVSLGDIDCKIIFTGDSVYLVNKEFKPEAINMDSISSIFRLMELSDLQLFILDEALERAGLTQSDLISYENLSVINKKEFANYILNADASFRF